jgi:hypothetical protein
LKEIYLVQKARLVRYGLIPITQFVSLINIPISCILVLELGAGSALPSLLLSTQANPPSLVVVTDYPDEGFLGNLRKNVGRNSAMAVTKGCAVKCEGYDWGTDPLKLP